MRVARIVALGLAVSLVACTSSVPTVPLTPTPTAEPGVVVVSVLLDLSGSRAPSGQPQRDAMQLFLDRPGGSVKLRVKFVDVAGSAAKTLLELRRAVVEDRAAAVIIGAPVTVDDAFVAAAQAASVPILLTLPAPPPPASVGGRWIFELAPTPDALARLLVGDLVERRVLAPLLLASDDTPAAVVERIAFANELGRRSLMVPTAVVTTQPDGPSRVRAAAAVARSAVFAGAAAPYLDLVRAMPSTSAARVYLPYATETRDVNDVRDQAAFLTWPGSRNLVAAGASGTRAGFLTQFTDRSGTPSTMAATAYDALALVSAAADESPRELDAPHLRARLETRTFAGVVTTYTFSFTRHAGFDESDLVYLARIGNSVRVAPSATPTPAPSPSASPTR